jgi:beta-carotene/zeaxanthin 4-ketolase
MRPHKTRDHRSRSGLTIAAAILAGWTALHIYSVFFFPPAGLDRLVLPLLVIAICWLNVGLFITAHDCMHGSLAPGMPIWNLWIGRLALMLYAGFNYDDLRPKHFAHHRSPGTGDDPDFSEAHPSAFWPWYADFLRGYFGLRQTTVLLAQLMIYLFAFGARIENVVLLWLAPAILSSLQLFLFGTFLPHRHDGKPFADEHRARSNDYGWIISLLTCFHFGYHHEHHQQPSLPWWRLPSARLP